MAIAPSGLSPELWVMNEKPPRLTRPRYPMPDFVRRAIESRGLMKAYNDRPPYQRNDYIGWITRAKMSQTRERRLEKMLGELDRGDRYMNMVYKPARSKHKDAAPEKRR